MVQSEYNPGEQESGPRLEPGQPPRQHRKQKKKTRKQSKKGLLVALKRLSVIQTLSIALALAVMSVGTTYFVMVKPSQPEPVAPVTVTLPVTETVQQPGGGQLPLTQEPAPQPLASPVGQVLRWSYDTGGHHKLSIPVAPYSHVYVSSYSSLYSVAYEGDLRWEFTTPDKGQLTAPTVNVDYNVIVADHRGIVYSLNGWGDVDWEHDLDRGVMGKPAVTSNGFVVLGSDKLHCLYPRGGERWSFASETTTFNRANPVMSSNILVAGKDGCLYAISYKGVLAWKLDLQLPHQAIPAVDTAGNIYVFSVKSGKMNKISAAGELLWAESIRGNNTTGVALMPDGSMLAAGFDAKITCFTSDGEIIWSTNAVSSQEHTPLVGSDGLIYVCAYDSVLVLNPDGSKLCRVKLPGGTSSGLAQGPGGSIYASSSGSEILSIKLAR